MNHAQLPINYSLSANCRFLDKNVSWSTVSGFSLLLLALTMLREVLNTRSDATLVAAMQRYFLANMLKCLKQAEFLFHQANGFTSMDSSGNSSYSLNSCWIAIVNGIASRAGTWFKSLWDCCFSHLIFANKFVRPTVRFSRLNGGSTLKTSVVSVVVRNPVESTEARSLPL